MMDISRMKGLAVGVIFHGSVVVEGILDCASTYFRPQPGVTLTSHDDFHIMGKETGKSMRKYPLSNEQFQRLRRDGSNGCLVFELLSERERQSFLVGGVSHEPSPSDILPSRPGEKARKDAGEQKDQLKA